MGRPQPCKILVDASRSVTASTCHNSTLIYLYQDGSCQEVSNQDLIDKIMELNKFS